jgi:hypothetical protein
VCDGVAAFSSTINEVGIPTNEEPDTCPHNFRGNRIVMCRKTFVNICRRENIPLALARGNNPSKQMTAEGAEIMPDEKGGLRKMKKILAMNGQDVSRSNLREFMIENELMQARGTPKPPKQRCPYVALETDAIWARSSGILISTNSLTEPGGFASISSHSLTTHRGESWVTRFWVISPTVSRKANPLSIKKLYNIKRI